jgi:hypothetical protein
VIFMPPLPLRNWTPLLFNAKYCSPTPIGKLVVSIPAGTSTAIVVWEPLLTNSVAGLVSMVVTNTSSLSKSYPFDRPTGSPVQVVFFDVGLYQYTTSSLVTVGVVAPAL